jgi:lipoprotein-anchoring transpeptidase ErfK/SrfK
MIRMRVSHSENPLCGSAVVRWTAVSIVAAAVGFGSLAPARSDELSLASVNAAQYATDIIAADAPNPALLKAQVLLARLDISPGQIDGRSGDNMRRAVAQFQRLCHLDATGDLDEATWTRLASSSAEPVLTDYQILPQDVKGPFEAQLSDDMRALARLRWLGYRNAAELIAAKFHVADDVLRQLNPDKHLDRAGETIVVPDIGVPRPLPQVSKIPVAKIEVAKIEIDKQNHEVRALGAGGEIVAFYPASIGSERKPSPSGSYKVRRVIRNPTYRYNPKFEPEPVDIKTKLNIAPGPNSPVGLVWIDFSKPTYGIHGTPDPHSIGKAASHGCVRLTNWDALDLAGRVRRGTEVVFLN